jgi:hypothetical protein
VRGWMNYYKELIVPTNNKVEVANWADFPKLDRRVYEAAKSLAIDRSGLSIFTALRIDTSLDVPKED